MILGEPDIQRQVKTALEEAQAARTVGTRLNRLFQDALVTGKRARTETGIARGTFSVGAAAVKLASQIFGETLTGHTVLVLGAGKMSEVTARHLQAAGAPAVLVANRTYEKAVALAEQFGGSARRFDDLPQLLTVADIVVCSTAAPHPIVTRALMQDVMRARRGRPLYLVDIAVPRDVESEVGKIDNAYLYNIDDLQELVAGARHTRAGEVARAREIVESSVTEYLRWERSLDVAPLVVAVRQKLDSVRLAELARLRTRLPDLSEKDWRTVEAALSSLTNKIAHPAIVAIKAAPETEDGAATLDAIRRAFGLEEGPPAHPNKTPNSGGCRNSPALFHIRLPQNWGQGGPMTEAALLIAAAALYLLGSVAYGAHLFLRLPALAVGRTTRGHLRRRAPHRRHWRALCRTHQTPFTTPAETLSASAWAVALAYLALELVLRPKPTALGAVALPAAFLCLFAGAFLHSAQPAALTPATPLLNSRLISLHILAILFAFGLLVLAFGCAALYLTQHRLLKRKRLAGGLFGKLPPLAGLDDLAFALVAFAFPLLTVGLAAGIVEAMTGGFRGHWAADPMVLTSVVTWLVYGVYLALHTFAQWRGPRANYLLVGGLLAALITYFMPTTTHRFG